MAEERLSLSWHTVEDVTVIRIGAPVSPSDEAVATAKLGELVSQSSGKVVIDMSDIKMLNSRTLAAIVSLNRKLETQGGQLRICQPASAVMKMFGTFGLLRTLHIDETEEDSVAALADMGDDKGPSSS